MATGVTRARLQHYDDIPQREQEAAQRHLDHIADAVDENSTINSAQKKSVMSAVMGKITQMLFNRDFQKETPPKVAIFNNFASPPEAVERIVNASASGAVGALAYTAVKAHPLAAIPLIAGGIVYQQNKEEIDRVVRYGRAFAGHEKSFEELDPSDQELVVEDRKVWKKIKEDHATVQKKLFGIISDQLNILWDLIYKRVK